MVPAGSCSWVSAAAMRCLWPWGSAEKRGTRFTASKRHMLRIASSEPSSAVNWSRCSVRTCTRARERERERGVAKV
jgi:hypothetical protein